MMRLSKSIRALAWSMAIPLLLGFGLAHAQSLRDPTLPPAEQGLANSALGEKPLSSETASMNIIVRNGRSYLLLGGLLYGQGEKLGEARIAQISETEVWFLEAGVLRKVSKFPGVQRHIMNPVLRVPVCANGAKTFPSAAPCANAHP